MLDLCRHSLCGMQPTADARGDRSLLCWTTARCACATRQRLARKVRYCPALCTTVTPATDTGGATGSGTRLSGCVSPTPPAAKATFDCAMAIDSAGVNAERAHLVVWGKWSTGAPTLHAYSVEVAAMEMEVAGELAVPGPAKKNAEASRSRPHPRPYVEPDTFVLAVHGGGVPCDST